MTAPENEFGEWAPPDPADVADYDARMSAYTAQETARQQERIAAEDRRQAMLAGDNTRTAEASHDWRMAQQEHQALRLEYVSLAEQQRGQHASPQAREAEEADREAGT